MLLPSTDGLGSSCNASDVVNVIVLVTISAITWAREA